MGSRRAAWIAAAGLGMASVASLGRARADVPPATDADAVAEAKELFRRGVALYEARDLESALDYFRRSRARFASLQNTLDVAICLEGLGRAGEALEAYDDVVASFGAELAGAERTSIAARMDALRTKAATLDVTSNVSGLVIVDGRERGRLPLARALRITGGHHVVRVMKDGYATFETELDIAAGARLTVDARLVALAVSGGLRVEDPALVGGDVIVDGAVVGVLPWEGTLAPGEHFVASRARAGNGDTGSAPARAFVVQGQTALVRLRSGALGGVARVVVTPRSATLRLNGVPVGRGQWEGALPEGAYRIEADELGYFARGVSFLASPSAPAFRGALELALGHGAPALAAPARRAFLVRRFRGVWRLALPRERRRGGLLVGLRARHAERRDRWCSRGLRAGVALLDRGRRGVSLRSRAARAKAHGPVGIGGLVGRHLQPRR